MNMSYCRFRKELAQEARDLVIMLAQSSVAVCDATIRRMDQDLTDDVLAGAIDRAADGVEDEEAEAEGVQS